MSDPTGIGPVDPIAQQFLDRMMPLVQGVVHDAFVELLPTIVRETVDKTKQEIQVPEKTPATVLSVDATTGAVVVHIDGDPARTVTRAEPLVAVTYAAGDRVMVEFHPPRACFIVGEIGTRTGRGVITPSAFILTSTASTSCATGTATAVAFDTETVDTDALHDPAANTKITIPTGKGGLWLISATVAWSGSSAGVRFLDFRKNGSTYVGPNVSGAPPGSTVHVQTMSGLVKLADGDYLEVYGTQTSGGSLSTIAASYSPFFSGFRVE